MYLGQCSSSKTWTLFFLFVQEKSDPSSPAEISPFAQFKTVLGYRHFSTHWNWQIESKKGNSNFPLNSSEQHSRERWAHSMWHLSSSLVYFSIKQQRWAHLRNTATLSTAAQCQVAEYLCIWSTTYWTKHFCCHSDRTTNGDYTAISACVLACCDAAKWQSKRVKNCHLKV